MVGNEDDTWAQTVITVTPEDDAVLRELSPTTVVSAQPDTPLTTDNIVYRRPFVSEEYIAPISETKLQDVIVEVKDLRDAENQTYLQGVPAVRIPVKDEASQTVYMSSPCPPLKYFRDIMTSMKDVPMPTPKRSIKVTTISSFHVSTLHNIVVDQLNLTIEEKIFKEFDAFEPEDKDANAKDILDFVLTRVLWISNPKSQRKRKGVDKETETLLRYNYRLRTMVMDNESQTGLTCEPKKSNRNLLKSYEESRKFVRSFLENALEKGIDSSTVAHEITDEIIGKCAERVKFPMIDATIQTVATYKLPCEKEEEVLRKLRIGVVVDPSEPYVIVQPLIDEILDDVCYFVSKDAKVVVKWIICSLVQKTVKIVVRLLEIGLESQPKSLDDVLDQRRRKIQELISKKSTESMSTQTFLAAVHEVTKIKEPKEMLCSLCKYKSPCTWCQVDSEEELAPVETKINRTQDILFAYKPCYIIATPSETRKYSYVQHTCRSDDQIKPKPLQTDIRTAKEESNETVNVVFKCVKKSISRDSSTGWSRVLDNALIRPWSTSGSASSSCKLTTCPTDKSVSEQRSRTLKCHRPPSQTQQALQILKNTFCTRGTCTATSRTPAEAECTAKQPENVSVLSHYCNCLRESEESYENEEFTVCSMPDPQVVFATGPSSSKLFRYCKHCDTKKHTSQCSSFKQLSVCGLSYCDSWKSLS